jgi:manganese oxidase
MQVQLRNHLPPLLPDGPQPLLALGDGTQSDAHFGHNFLSMITDGFNINQFRMSSSIGLSAPMVAQHPITSDGSNVGINSAEVSKFANTAKWQGSLVPPCRAGSSGELCKTTYVWYAGNFEVDDRGVQLKDPIELGVLPLRSFGDAIKHPMHGAVGALVIGPRGSRVCTDSEYGDARERDADKGSALSANLCDAATGKLLYRDLVTVVQDAVEMQQQGRPLANLKGAEEPDDYGAKAFNYRSEPMWGRRGGDPSIEFEERNAFDYARALSSKPSATAAGKVTACHAAISPLDAFKGRECDPETPVFVARAGRELRLRLVHPGGHTRQQAISLAGHAFNPFPYEAGSKALRRGAAESVADAWIVQGHVNALGPMGSANVLVQAGGANQIPLDYLMRSQASFLFDGGLWGLLRVLPAQP